MGIIKEFNSYTKRIEELVQEGEYDAYSIACKVADYFSMPLADFSVVFKAVSETSLYEYIFGRKLVSAIQYLYETAGSDMEGVLLRSGFTDICSLRVELYDRGFGDLERIVEEKELELSSLLQWKDSYEQNYLSKSYSRINHDDSPFQYQDLDPIKEGGSYRRLVDKRRNLSTNYSKMPSSDVLLAEELKKYYCLPEEFCVYAIIISETENRTLQDCFRFVESLYELYASSLDLDAYTPEVFLNGIYGVKLLRDYFFELGVSAKAVAWLSWRFVDSSYDTIEQLRDYLEDPVMLGHYPLFQYDVAMWEKLGSYGDNEDYYDDYDDYGSYIKTNYNDYFNSFDGLFYSMPTFEIAYHAFVDRFDLIKNEKLFQSYIGDVLLKARSEDDIINILDTIEDERMPAEKSIKPISLLDNEDNDFLDDSIEDGFDPEAYLDDYQEYELFEKEELNADELLDMNSILRQKLREAKFLYHQLYGVGKFVKLLESEGREKVVVRFAKGQGEKRFNFPECFSTGGLRFLKT